MSVVTHTYTLFSNYVEYISPEQSFQSTPRQLLAPAAQPFTLVGSDSTIRFGCFISSHISISAKIRAPEYKAVDIFLQHLYRAGRGVLFVMFFRASCEGLPGQ